MKEDPCGDVYGTLDPTHWANLRRPCYRAINDCVELPRSLRETKVSQPMTTDSKPVIHHCPTSTGIGDEATYALVREHIFPFQSGNSEPRHRSRMGGGGLSTRFDSRLSEVQAFGGAIGREMLEGRQTGNSSCFTWRPLSTVDLSPSFEAMPFVYHLVSRDFVGTTLYPLNQLREQLPEVYSAEVAKWAGRESVLDYTVPLIGVPWADTVNLSALHPKHLVAERRKLGVPFSRLLERRVAQIPVDRLIGLPCVSYRGASHWRNSSPGDASVPHTPPETEFSEFSIEEYIEESRVPDFHTQYLLRQKERGELALGFVGIPHVLVAGPIDLTGLQFVGLDDSA